MPISYKNSVLIVEDDEGVALLEERALSRRGYIVTSVSDIDSAILAVQKKPFDLIVADYALKYGTGLELLSKIQSIGLDIPVILVTGFSDEATIISAIRGGAHDFVPKTAEYLHYLPDAVERVLRGVRTERELSKSKALFQLFMDNSPAAAFIKDEEGRMIYANQRTLQIIGRDDLIGKSDFELWPESIASQLKANDLEVLSTNKATDRVETVQLPSGEERHFHSYKFPMLDATGQRLIGGMAVDVTQQRAMEEALQQRNEQLRQSQKMEAVGTLAGGVAHEFNNLLQVVLGYTRFAIDSIPQQHSALADLEIVVSAAERAAQLTQQLLSFSRREPGKSTLLDVNAAIVETAAMLRPLLGAPITIKLDLDEQIGLILADGAEVQQVLMNLCINARDSMPNGGQITIATQEVYIDKDQSNLSVPNSGSFVSIRVSDTGCGMSAEIRQKIFEPFFTTKPVGKGTGLGLAMVFRVTQNHGGAIQVESEIGKGSTFMLYFPANLSPCQKSDPLDANLDSPGPATILIAEDEPQILGMTKRMLESFGYRIIPAVDGDEAVRIFEENIDQIDLILLDAVMPNLGGWDALQKIRQIRSTVPIIVTTGCDSVPPPDHCDSELPRIVHKPFVLENLLKTINEVVSANEEFCVAHHI